MNITMSNYTVHSYYSCLIIFPLIISYKAEKSKKQDEWDKIADYGNKINEKSRKNKLY